MQIILLENIKNLGQIGDVVKVKNGFARNYLIKFGKALNASKENIEIVNKKKTELNKKNVEKKKNAKKVFDIINQKKYMVSKIAMENDELYGSVKPREISDIIKKQDNLEIKTSSIDLNNVINKIGTHKVNVNLHAEIQAKILIEVVKESEKK